MVDIPDAFFTLVSMHLHKLYFLLWSTMPKQLKSFKSSGSFSVMHYCTTPEIFSIDVSYLGKYFIQCSYGVIISLCSYNESKSFFHLTKENSNPATSIQVIIYVSQTVCSQ